MGPPPLHDPAWPVADPTIVAGAIAATTRTIRFGIVMLALPRRRPWKVAKELATLDVLSRGRLVVGAALGSMAREFDAFGEDPDPRHRARLLDDGLEIVAAGLEGRSLGHRYTAEGVQLLPAAVQRPRPPIWIGGRWPARAPFRRAAAWDGVVPTHADHGKGDTMPPHVLSEIAAYVTAHRDDDRPFDIAIEGRTDAGGTGTAARLAAYARAGATWWIEALGWWRGDVAAARARILAGPPE